MTIKTTLLIFFFFFFLSLSQMIMETWFVFEYLVFLWVGAMAYVLLIWTFRITSTVLVSCYIALPEFKLSIHAPTHTQAHTKQMETIKYILDKLTYSTKKLVIVINFLTVSIDICIKNNIWNKALIINCCYF